MFMSYKAHKSCPKNIWALFKGVKGVNISKWMIIILNKTIVKRKIFCVFLQVYRVIAQKIGWLTILNFSCFWLLYHKDWFWKFKKKQLISRSSENRQKFIFSLVFPLKRGGGGYICINILETRLGPLPDFFLYWNIYMPMDDISKKIKTLIITNDFRERETYPLNAYWMIAFKMSDLILQGTVNFITVMALALLAS